MTLESQFDVAVTDDAVNFSFAVKNEGADSVDLEFRSGKIADIIVFESDEVVWRWSDGQMFTQMLQTKTLDPGESLIHDAQWSDPDPGAYTARAVLEATNDEVEDRTEFEV